jgi:LuxR family maltose regulon positive regulatory protein
MNYLVAALQKLDPEIDNTSLNLLRSPQPMLHNAALSALLNQIEDINTNSILVFDDFHHIRDVNIHQSIDYLLNYFPESLQLVISTRSDPLINLSRLRAQGEMLEIRMDQLRFNEEEVKQFFQTDDDLKISDENITLLTKRTEGWISGLQMASLSLRGKQNVDEFVNSFSGSHKYILDYLIEEVLERQPVEIQQFLLFTSILERISGPLCDDLLGRNDSQMILEQLERENLFLIPLDDQRHWYRYHQLFKDLLMNRLSLEYSEQTKDLYQKASLWHENAGWYSLAIDYALEAEDFDKAMELILEEAENTLMRGEVNIYQGWISMLPNRLLQGNAEIKFLDMWCGILRGEDIVNGETSVDAITTAQSVLSGRKETLLAFVNISKGEFGLAGEYAEKASGKLEPEDHYFRALAGWILGVSHALKHDFKGALDVLENLSASLDLEQNPMMKVLLLSQAARTYARLGNFTQAQQIFNQALETAKDRQGNRIPIAGEALMALGDLYREQYKLDQATDLIMEGIELTQQWRRGAAIEGYLFLSRVKQLQNDWESAHQALEKAEELAVEYVMIDMDDRWVETYQARLWCFEGIPHPVEEWAHKPDSNEEVGDIIIDGIFNIENYLLCREKIVLARFYFITQQYDKAFSLTKKLILAFEKYGRLDLLIELHLLRCLILQKKQETEQSLQALEKAVNLGEKGGFIGLFIECGTDLMDILQQYVKKRGVTAYIKNILDAFNDESDETKVSHHLLPDPLSDREMDVLRHLPGNLTTPEIAEEMVISINTVRTHIKSIYQKLGVHKRSEAVKRAKELNML